ncbi:polyprenyl synthetase family protein, partial [Streptococcus pyogenes]
ITEQSQEVIHQLTKAGDLVGHAFQVRDDILDLTASFDDLGKTPKKDLQAEKATYPSLLGLEKSYQLLNESLNQAQSIFQ